MKNLLLLFTIWRSIYITLSDVITMTHYVGTIKFGKTPHFKIHCIDDCKLEEVRATFDDRGKLHVMGYYYNGEGILTFCSGLSSGNTATKCVMKETEGLSKAIIMLWAYTKDTHNVRLSVTGHSDNLLGIGDPLKYSVGTISRFPSAYFSINCKGDCYLGKVDTTFRSGGDVKVIGNYGESRMKFCEGSPLNDTATTCVSKKKTGLSNVLIKITAQQTSYNVELAVTGANLLRIQRLSSLVTLVGNLDQNQHALYDVKCKKGACNLVEVSATFKKEGDVDLHGYCHGNIPFCDGEDRNTAGFQNCPIYKTDGLNHVQVIVKGYNRSENVELIVTGYNLESVTYTGTHQG